MTIIGLANRACSLYPKQHNRKERLHAGLSVKRTGTKPQKDKGKLKKILMFIIWFTFDKAKVGAQRAVWPSQAPDITLQYLAGSHRGPHATHSWRAVKAKQPLSADPAVMRSGSRLMPIQDAGIRHPGSGPLNTKSPGSRCQQSMFEQQVLIKYQKKITGFEYCIKIHLF